MDYIQLIIVFGFGIIFGSFINAWVWRIENDLSITKGRSVCPHCKHKLSWYDLVPVLSFLMLRGKCRYCKAKISSQYPIIELATGLLFVSLLIYNGSEGLQGWVGLILLCGATIFLVSAYIYDAKHMLLPDIFSVPAIFLGLIYFGLNIFWQGYNALIPQAIGLAVVVLFFGGIWYLSKGKWLGSGDIRIAVVMGLFLAPKQLAVAVFVAYLLGAIYGVFIILSSKTRKGHRVPFGPFLIIGFYFGLFYGQELANWYLRLL